MTPGPSPRPDTLLVDPRSGANLIVPGREIGPMTTRVVALVADVAKKIDIGSGKYHIDIHYATSQIRSGNTDTYIKIGGSNITDEIGITLYPGQTFQYRNVASDFELYARSPSANVTLDIAEYESTAETYINRQ